MEKRNSKFKTKEKWVVFKNTPDGIEYLFDISSSGKIHTTCYIENAMSFDKPEIAKKMRSVVEDISDDWYNSSIGKLITAMEILEEK